MKNRSPQHLRLKQDILVLRLGLSKQKQKQNPAANKKQNLH